MATHCVTTRVTSWFVKKIWYNTNVVLHLSWKFFNHTNLSFSIMIQDSTVCGV